MKLDKFTWAVIAVVVLLVAGAIFTVTRARGDEGSAVVYIEDDVPEAPVQNAFLALERGDRTRARAQYSQTILDDIEKQTGYDPYSGRGGDQASRRLRISAVEIDPDNPDLARVTFVLDTYNRGGGLFGAGNSYSQQRTVEVIREDGRWKINAQEFFW